MELEPFLVRLCSPLIRDLRIETTAAVQIRVYGTIRPGNSSRSASNVIVQLKEKECRVNAMAPHRASASLGICGLLGIYFEGSIDTKPRVVL